MQLAAMSCKPVKQHFDLFNKLVDDTLESSEAALIELKLNKKDLQVKEINAKGLFALVHHKFLPLRQFYIR